MKAPRPADRTSLIKPFYVMELVKKADALAEQGAPIIHLSIGEPDFTAPEPVVKALNKVANEGRTGYTAALGIAPLREAISAYYESHWHVTVDPQRILVTSGASAALSLASCAMVNPGDGVIVSDPGYPCNRQFITAFNGVPQPVTVGPEHNFQLTQELIHKNWQAHTRGVLLSTPANPTGTMVAGSELEKIIAEVRARDGFLIVDEIYLGLNYRDDAATALNYGDDIIITNSFSKYFHMTGWRLGWLVLPPALVPDFEKLAQNLYICPSTLAQHAAVACFDEESMQIYRQRHQSFAERRAYLVPALRAIGLDIPVEPDGAFYVYADISKFSTDSMAFANDLLEKAHVAVVPGADFGDSAPENYIRISYANSMQNLKTAVNRIESYLATLSNQPKRQA